MHRIFLKFGSFEIRWFGVMIAIGFLSAIWLAYRRAPRAGIPGETISELCFWAVLAGFLAARLFYVLTNWGYFWEHPSQILRIDRGGIVFYGGLIGGLGAAIVFCRRKNLDFWKVADVIAPALALAHAFGRLGCFMNGCCYGRSCSLPWGVQFPPDTVADWPSDAPSGPVHPTQLYEAAFLFYFAFSLIIIDRLKKFQGQTFATYVMLYAIFRFIVEFWRGDVPTHFGLTIAQWLSIPLFAVSWWWLTVRRKQWGLERRKQILAQAESLANEAKKDDPATRRHGESGKKRR